MVIRWLASPHRAGLPARFQMAPWFLECNSAFAIREATFLGIGARTTGNQSGAGAPIGGDCGGRTGEGLGITTSGEPGSMEAGADGLGSTAGRERSQPPSPTTITRGAALSHHRLPPPPPSRPPHPPR